MSMFGELKTQLVAARAARGLPPPGPLLDSWEEWHKEQRRSEWLISEALWAMCCLTHEDATLAELEEAVTLTGEQPNSDLVFRWRGAQALARTSWSIGDRVEVLAPLRSTNKRGEMVPCSDRVTGLRGRIIGATDASDYLEIEIRADSGNVEWLYHERVQKV